MTDLTASEPANAGSVGVSPPPAGHANRSAVYTYYVIAVLSLAYGFSVMDRFLIGLMIGPIKAEFNLGDTEIGLLMGFGFVLFYSIFGLPFGLAADRSNRRNLMVGGLVCWTLATAACGLAAGFRSLLFARAMVGVGEATLTPSALSTIADRVKRHRLSFAIGLYTIGSTIGAGVAMGLGGRLVEWTQDQVWQLPWGTQIAGWHVAFVVVGLAGIPLALLMLLTVREAPRRVRVDANASTFPLLPTVRKQKRAFAAVFSGYAIGGMAGFLPYLWAPALLARVHNLTPSQIGLCMGLIIGVGGSVGILGSGALADRLAKRGSCDAPVTVVRAAFVLQLPFYITAYLTESSTVALGCLAIGVTLASAYNVLQSSTIQLLTPPPLHGRMMAIYLLCINMMGMGLGPLIVGWMSDHFMELGEAMATVTTIAILVGSIILYLYRDSIATAIKAQEH